MKLFRHTLFAVLIGLTGMAQAEPAYQEQSTVAAPLNAGYREVLFGQAENFSANAVNGTGAQSMSHVPEPEGWTMYLLGLGFVVYQIRRRVKRRSSAWNLNKKQ